MITTKVDMSNHPGWSFYATGGRKNACARVYMKPGAGKVTINGLEPLAYFDTESRVVHAMYPLVLANIANSYDLMIKVKGGGKNGQSGATRHGIGRVVAQLSEESRVTMRKNGLLTRDSRMVERKKYGCRKARRAPQFSKR